jgi:hypothetical protein
MNKSVCFIAFLCLFIAEAASACGPEWTYIGYDYESPNYIHELADSAGIFLRGIPGVGVFRWIESDTVWELVSLPQQGVNEIKEFSSFPHQIFAQVDCGDLSKSFDNGFNWIPIHVSQTGNLYDYTDFLINPIDSTIWYLAAHTPTMDDDIFVSTDAGITWNRVILSGLCSKLMWFAETPDMLYSGRRQIFNSIRMSDYATQPLMSIETEYSIISIIRHPDQPWVYILGRGINGLVVRYDVLTGDTLSRTLPDTVTAYYDNNLYMKYIENQGFLIGGSEHLFLLSDNLQILQEIDGPVVNTWSTEILFASTTLWIVEVSGYGLFCRSPIDQNAPDRPQRSNTSIAFFPNPAREFISFVPANQAVSRVEIYNLLGQRVLDWSGTNTNTSFSVPLSSLGSGTYFYRLYTPSDGITPIQKNTFTIVK